MKRILTIIALLSSGIVAIAQSYDYKPRESWPYLLEEFTAGEVRTSSGALLQDGFYNVCVTDGKLHYVNDGTIMVANMLQIYTVQIGSRLFCNYSGCLYEVVDQQGYGFLVKKVLVDMSALNSSDIGYGISSATASTQRTNNLGVDGGVTANVQLQTAVANAMSGPELPLQESWFFLYRGNLIEANKRAFLHMDGMDQAAAKAFLKRERIRWNKPESLSKVLEFIVENYTE